MFNFNLLQRENGGRRPRERTGRKPQCTLSIACKERIAQEMEPFTQRLQTQLQVKKVCLLQLRGRTHLSRKLWKVFSTVSPQASKQASQKSQLVLFNKEKKTQASACY